MSKQPTRQFVAAVPFNANIFSYATSYNAQTGQTTGALSALAGATVANCPAGRILRESGKKLYPAAHPGVSTYMVGVIDSITFLQGFIDPNSPVFAVSDSDLPFHLSAVDPVTSRLDAADPVYTNGVVVSRGQMRNVGAAGQRVPLDGTQSSLAIDISQGSFVYIDGNGTNTLTIGNFNFGDRMFLQCNANTGNVIFSTGFAVNTNNFAKDRLMMTFVCDGYHMVEQSRSQWLLTY
jgi:hypothetical protein